MDRELSERGKSAPTVGVSVRAIQKATPLRYLRAKNGVRCGELREPATQLEDIEVGGKFRFVDCDLHPAAGCHVRERLAKAEPRPLGETLAHDAQELFGCSRADESLNQAVTAGDATQTARAIVAESDG
jgi:hypothetical protein